MPVAVADAIEHARDGHPAFTVQRVPPAVLIRALERYAVDLIGLLALEAESALDVSETASALAAGQFPGPFTFAPTAMALHVLSIEVLQGTGTTYVPVEEVVEAQRYGASKHPACYVRRGRAIYPLREKSVWDASGFTSWRIRYVPDPRPLGLKTVGGQSITIVPLPDDALAPCACYLAYCAAKKVETDAKPAIDVDQFRTEYETAEARFLERQKGHNRAVFRVQDSQPW